VSTDLPIPTPSPGQFRKGGSGNPAGWPFGARNRATALAEQLLRVMVPIDPEAPVWVREELAGGVRGGGGRGGGPCVTPVDRLYLQAGGMIEVGAVGTDPR
jgi:hypothetical protein